MDEPPVETVMGAREETSFVKDQIPKSLRDYSESAMVAAAVGLYGAALFFFL